MISETAGVELIGAYFTDVNVCTYAEEKQTTNRRYDNQLLKTMSPPVKALCVFFEGLCSLIFFSSRGKINVFISFFTNRASMISETAGVELIGAYFIDVNVCTNAEEKQTSNRNYDNQLLKTMSSPVQSS